jgi:hypothetical protein
VTQLKETLITMRETPSNPTKTMHKHL